MQFPLLSDYGKRNLSQLTPMVITSLGKIRTVCNWKIRTLWFLLPRDKSHSKALRHQWEWWKSSNCTSHLSSTHLFHNFIYLFLPLLFLKPKTSGKDKDDIPDPRAPFWLLSQSTRKTWHGFTSGKHVSEESTDINTLVRTELYLEMRTVLLRSTGHGSWGAADKHLSLPWTPNCKALHLCCLTSASSAAVKQRCYVSLSEDLQVNYVDPQIQSDWQLSHLQPKFLPVTRLASLQWLIRTVWISCEKNDYWESCYLPATELCLAIPYSYLNIANNFITC